jgi:C4-dicarboxylate-specific signal transduction histidine kinase
MTHIYTYVVLLLIIIAALCYIVHLLERLDEQRQRLDVIRARYGDEIDDHAATIRHLVRRYQALLQEHVLLRDGLRLMPGRLVIETVVRPPRDVRLN